MRNSVSKELFLTPIEFLPKTASRTISRLKSVGIGTYENLLHYYPFRYNDFSVTSKIENLQAGETVTVRGKILSIRNIFTRRRITIQEAILQDQSGKMKLIWYNQPYLTRMLSKDKYISVSGVIEKDNNLLVMKPIEFEILVSLESEAIHTGRIAPVYSTIYGLSSKTIREKIHYIVTKINLEEYTANELIPDEIIRSNKLVSLRDAINKIHNPTNNDDIKMASRRLGFDELFIRILSSQLVKKQWRQEKVNHVISITNSDKDKIAKFISNLPFKLTKSQEGAVGDILGDLQKLSPMNRFLQGDVGSGKTVVALIAAYLMFLKDKMTLIMAPTEILAKQHFTTISKLAKKTGIRIALQTGSHKDIKTKDDIDKYSIIVGTHALINMPYKFNRVALVIIDEQHRFGVQQRAILSKYGIHPHLLSMTATPIPRTVSLTIYSELDLSIIDELPAGRKTIKTHIVPFHKRQACYEWIKTQISTCAVQAFIVCPLIETSEKETFKTIKAAKTEYENLKNNIFPSLKIALLHGKMKANEKNNIMENFKNKNIDILVTTSVVEVGIDVPNATIMLIEGAERFGLAQLHQLRGRVGRADKQSYCFLHVSNFTQATARLTYFAKTNSGLALSEYDLKLRGPGEMYGKAQHGYSDLRIANLSDARLIVEVKNAVFIFLEKYSIEKFFKLKRMLDSYNLPLIAKN